MGGGFAGVAAARELERIGRRDVDVTLVSRQNFMLFTPMLPEVAAGSLAARDIMQPLRASTHDRGQMAASSRFELGEATGVDLVRRAVTVRHPVTHESRFVEYDELVLAVGATASTMGVPGVEELAIRLKTISDAEVVRTRVVGALEAAAEANDLLERSLPALHLFADSSAGSSSGRVRRTAARPSTRQVRQIRGVLELAKQKAAAESSTSRQSTRSSQCPRTRLIVRPKSAFVC